MSVSIEKIGFLDLPIELYNNIFNYLDPRSITAMAKTTSIIQQISLAYLTPLYEEIPRFFNDLQNTLPERNYNLVPIKIAKNAPVENAYNIYHNLATIKDIFSIRIPGPYSLISYLDAIKDAIQWTLALYHKHECKTFDHLPPPKLLDISYEKSPEVYRHMESDHGPGYLVPISTNAMFHGAIACAIAATCQFKEAGEYVKAFSATITTWGQVAPMDLAWGKIAIIAARVGRMTTALIYSTILPIELRGAHFSDILSELLKENDVKGTCQLLDNTPWIDEYNQILLNDPQKNLVEENLSTSEEFELSHLSDRARQQLFFSEHQKTWKQLFFNKH